MSKVIFRPDPLGMAHLRSWQGPVGRVMDRRIRDAEYMAKATVGVQTSRLRDSISSTRTYTRRGDLESKLGANVHEPEVSIGYALYHHEGTKPHVIRPKRAKALKFRWFGVNIFRARVNHPGTRANHFLTRQLRRLTG